MVKFSVILAYGYHFHANDILKYTHLFVQEMLIGKLLCAMYCTVYCGNTSMNCILKKSSIQ